MKKIIILLLLVSLNLNAQNAKNKGWYIQEIHFPEIALPENFTTYATKIRSNTDNIKLIVNGEQKTTAYSNPDIANSVKRYLEMPNFTTSETPDFIIEFTDLGVKHIIRVEEKKGYGEKAVNTYTGIVELTSSIKVVVKDNEDNILYDNTFSDKYKSESAGVYNNASIKSSSIALSQIKNQYIANARDYRTVKNNKISDNVVIKISKGLKSAFTSYYEKQRINLFHIKKEEKYGISNNDQVDQLLALNAVEFSDTYLEDLKVIANKSLIHFKKELDKITDKTDKKQKKVYWSLLSNISGVYYALGDYEKAIEFAKLRDEVNYNNKWKFNLEIAEDRKKIIDKNKK
ncbi:hypothetical protein [Psychroserpens sp. NJDZ02]|uniref:hypothetical protein n=1 Tax=Psychroserpens sp. NJDZ02 TaxID=2570561 RepID=UPI0010A8DB02|nr:hypothetical protein [Psychroserpens sp. NJDZ02]QCE42135.1 hypothetical protein E9099_12225 [Psychroserpens sp. NJDZ02]